MLSVLLPRLHQVPSTTPVYDFFRTEDVDHGARLNCFAMAGRRQPPARHRTIRAKGCLSNTTALAMVFKLVEDAQKSWRRLDGHNQLSKVVLGVRFTGAGPGGLLDPNALRRNKPTHRH